MIRLDHPLIVGSGVAGLAVALDLPEATILTRGDGSTTLAQGGVAAAVGPDDDPRLHGEDTMAVSAGLAVPEVVEILCQEGPSVIARLSGLGARFDRNPDGRLRLGLEAGHRRRRIVAADGDAIGRQLLETLGRAVETSGSVQLLQGWTAIDLLTDGRRVTGVVAADPEDRRHRILATAVVLATGGLGHLYLHTTNPPQVDGAGMAMAGRAGAFLTDLEFVQFHPTALDVGSDPMPLISEALRGEGAVLVDETGERFMPRIHPGAELAPRDVVARAIWQRRQKGERIFLDARHIADVASRFPTVTAHARAAGMDPALHLLPVGPAAHYLMGGIEVDTRGRTSLEGLWAVGETAGTGAHGANRLASNSLLEGMVFAARAAIDVNQEAAPPSRVGTEPSAGFEASLDPVPEIEELRRLMWDQVGVVRNPAGLETARRRISELGPALTKTIPGRVAHDVAGWVVTSALGRPESRGGHFRSDLPDPDRRQAVRRRLRPLLPGDRT